MKTKHVWLAGGLAAFIAANCMDGSAIAGIVLLVTGFFWTVLGIFCEGGSE